MTPPTLRQLRYLVSLCETLNFSRAAELCHVTQSTLSGAIQDLEGLLRLSLFERSKRKVIPTAAGIDLAARARRILAETDGFMEASADHADQSLAPIRLGMIPTIGPFLLPRLLPLLRQSLPGLKLILREDQSARLLAQLAAGDLDLLVLAFPYDCPDMETHLFLTDPFWAALPTSHPLVGRSVVSPNDVEGDQLLLLEDGHCLRDHVLAACSLRGRSNAVQGTSLYTLLQMVADGLGVSMVPDMAVGSAMLAGLDVRFRPMPLDTPARRIGLVWRPSSGRKTLFLSLGKLLGANLTPQGRAGGSE